MTDGSLPAVFLTFDDADVDAWTSQITACRYLGIAATFYCSLVDPSSRERADNDKYWEGVRLLRDAGHAIGYHTVSHLNCAEMVVQRGLERWLDEEIELGMSAFVAHGIEPRDFAYPYGMHDDTTDVALLRRFNTLRLAQTEGELFKTYSADELRDGRIFDAPDIADPSTCANVEWAISAGRSIFLHGHRFDHPSGRVNAIAGCVKRIGARFATVAELHPA